MLANRGSVIVGMGAFEVLFSLTLRLFFDGSDMAELAS